MKHISLSSLFILLLGLIASCGQPTQIATIAPPTMPSEQLDKTSTGFYWPTGTSEIGDYADWLSNGCSWSGNYTYDPNYFHVGTDIAANEGDQVYAIADGEVLWKSEKDWGANNIALLIVHSLSDGSSFTAVYGHIRSDLKQGDHVEGGKPFATIGPWDDGSHLHFGIRPGTSIKDPYGRMPCPTQGPIVDYNGFVDPIEWITTRSPGEQIAAITPVSLPTHTSPAPVPTPTQLRPTAVSTPIPTISTSYQGPLLGTWVDNDFGLEWVFTEQWQLILISEDKSEQEILPFEIIDASKNLFMIYGNGESPMTTKEQYIEEAEQNGESLNEYLIRHGLALTYSNTENTLIINWPDGINYLTRVSD